MYKLFIGEDNMAKKKDVVVEDTIIVDEKENEVKEKEVLKLNPCESLVYSCIKTVFVGGFMVGELLGCSTKKSNDESMPSG